MSRLTQKLRDEIHKGVVNDAALAVLRRRQQRQAKKAMRSHKAQLEAEALAKSYRHKGHPKAAEEQDAVAARAEHRAIASHRRAQELIARIKARTRRKDEIQAAIKALRHELAKLGPHVTNNIPDRAEGGNGAQRIVWIANKSIGAGWFYSQSGGFTTSYVWNRIPAGYRSDCSQYAISVSHAAGLPSPSGTYDAGFTGSIADTCTRVSSLRPGDYVLYGTYPYHHIEIYVGHGLTVGHGSAPIDHGTPGMLGGPIAYYRPPGV